MELRPNTYNRVLSVDVEAASKDTRWYHSSYSSANPLMISMIERTFLDWHLAVIPRVLLVLLPAFLLSTNFSMQKLVLYPVPGLILGSIPFLANLSYQIYPKKESIIRMGPTFDIQHTYIPGGTLTDRSYQLGYQFRFSNASSLQFSFNHVFQKLTNSFNLLDPSQYTGFQEGEEYNWNAVSIEYKSNPRKSFFYEISGGYGGFYNGENFNLSGELTYRYQPFGNIALRFDFNDLQLPENYGQEQLFLIGPRIDLTFTDKIFLTTYVQYNNVFDNINLNARFQWRYQPASDLFLVYTENYLPADLFSKNRALVFKMTYWLNL